MKISNVIFNIHNLHNSMKKN